MSIFHRPVMVSALLISERYNRYTSVQPITYIVTGPLQLELLNPTSRINDI